MCAQPCPRRLCSIWIDGRCGSTCSSIAETGSRSLVRILSPRPVQQTSNSCFNWGEMSSELYTEFPSGEAVHNSSSQEWRDGECKLSQPSKRYEGYPNVSAEQNCPRGAYWWCPSRADALGKSQQSSNDTKPTAAQSPGPVILQSEVEGWFQGGGHTSAATWTLKGWARGAPEPGAPTNSCRRQSSRDSVVTPKVFLGPGNSRLGLFLA